MAVQTAVKQELKKANAAAAVTQMSVAGMGGEEQGAAARGAPDTDGTGTAARKSEKVGQQSRMLQQTVIHTACFQQNGQAIINLKHQHFFQKNGCVPCDAPKVHSLQTIWL